MPEHKLTYRDQSDKPAFNIAVVLNRKTVTGDVGLEIEVEGNSFPKPEGDEGTHTPVKMPKSKFWSYVHDGSLRGCDNAEYVLTKPIDFSAVTPAVNELYAMLKDHGSELDASNRTSVHVHLNCQQFHLNRLTSLMCAWFAVEEVLVQWCGESRVGNLFCLRAVDAPAIIGYLRKFIKTDGGFELHDILHYAGLNPHSLHKHGSIEIRTLRGCTDDPTMVLEWVSILQRIYELSAKFEDPRELVAHFSSGGPLSFFDFILGDRAEVVRAGVQWPNSAIAEAVTRGMRFAQDLAFCRDWSKYKPVDIKPDPFNRDMRKIATKLMDLDTPVSGSDQPAIVGSAGLQQAMLAAQQTMSAAMIQQEAQEPEDPFHVSW